MVRLLLDAGADKDAEDDVSCRCVICVLILIMWWQIMHQLFFSSFFFNCISNFPNSTSWQLSSFLN